MPKRQTCWICRGEHGGNSAEREACPVHGLEAERRRKSDACAQCDGKGHQGAAFTDWTRCTACGGSGKREERTIYDAVEEAETLLGETLDQIDPPVPGMAAWVRTRLEMIGKALNNRPDYPRLTPAEYYGEPNTTYTTSNEGIAQLRSEHAARALTEWASELPVTASVMFGMKVPDGTGNPPLTLMTPINIVVEAMGGHRLFVGFEDGTTTVAGFGVYEPQSGEQQIVADDAERVTADNMMRDIVAEGILDRTDQRNEREGSL